MLSDFLKTVVGLVLAGEFGLLGEYFDLIKLIISRPNEPNPRLTITAVVSNK